ncbi:MAG: hypothetical protein HY348_02980 [Nitrospira defluvii]|nr:hypothetical protein [Nitrospira defluvii]
MLRPPHAFLAATMATITALLVCLSSVGDFQGKWHANRVAASAMENLAYDLLRQSAPNNIDAILTRIQSINDTRDKAIVGELSEPKPGK